MRRREAPVLVVLQPRFLTQCAEPVAGTKAVSQSPSTRRTFIDVANRS
ncbi:MAG: hypothetical protein RIR69_245 [Actinomycetota bacterium]|jgi:hypothetical protein